MITISDQVFGAAIVDTDMSVTGSDLIAEQLETEIILTESDKYQPDRLFELFENIKENYDIVLYEQEELDEEAEY